MAEGYTLKWNGPEIISKYRQAQVAGVAEVATLSASSAAQNTPVVTGLAQGSVRAKSLLFRAAACFLFGEASAWTTISGLNCA